LPAVLSRNGRSHVPVFTIERHESERAKLAIQRQGHRQVKDTLFAASPPRNPQFNFVSPIIRLNYTPPLQLGSRTCSCTVATGRSNATHLACLELTQTTYSTI